MKNEKQQQARNLYFQTDLSQAQIAKNLEIDPKTLYNWMSEGRWRQQKKAADHMPSKIVEQQYYMLANLGHEILSRGHQPYPLTHEGEAMKKIANTIRHLKNRQTVNEAMESFTHLAEIIHQHEPDLAERIRPYIQKYIQNRVDVKFADLADEKYKVSPSMDEMYDYEIRPFDDDETGGITDPNTPSPTTGPGSAGQTTPVDSNPIYNTPAPVTPVTPETPATVAAETNITVTSALNAKGQADAIVTQPDHVANPTALPLSAAEAFSAKVAARPLAGCVINTPCPIAYWWNPDDTSDTLSVNAPTEPDKPILIAA